jgi:Flp pilus assembly protein TadG
MAVHPVNRFDKNRRLRSERGVAILEVALTLPLLLLVCVGIFEFGRAYQTWAVLTNAAREGARVAVLPTAVNGAVDARVREYLDIGGLRTDDAVLVAVNPATVSIGAAGTATASRVVVTYPYSFMVLQPVAQLVVSGSMTGAPITLTAGATMRNEQ